MLKNYLTIAFRNLLKYKVYTFINLLGLAVGLACVLVIIAYVKLEFSYDQFHAHKDRIYRVAAYVSFLDGDEVRTAATYAPLASWLEGNFASIEKLARVFPYPTLVYTDPASKFKEDYFAFADSTFFEIFTFEPVAGELSMALDRPFSVVITQKIAHRFFGNINPIGEALTFEDDNGKHTFTVTAVIEDMPQHSHFSFDYVASFSSLPTVMPWYNNWHYPFMYTYLLLQEGASPDTLAKGFTQLVENRRDLAQDGESKYEVFLQPLTGIHLHSDLEGEMQGSGNYMYVMLFVLAAGFILFIACINFMNLATSTASQRAREVGVRKILGAARKQLIVQFLGESLMTVLLAFVIAFGLAELMLLFFFNAFVGKVLSLHFLFQWSYAILLVMAIVLISLLAGLYPAFFLSQFRPIKVLTGRLQTYLGVVNVRKGLVIFQFFISGVLLLGTMVVWQQVNFLMNKELGFDKEHIITLHLVASDDQERCKELKNEIARDSRVISATVSSGYPGKETGVQYFEYFPENRVGDEKYYFPTLGVADEDFIKVYGIDVVQGRNFSPDYPNDIKDAFLINEKAAERLGWENPVGKTLTMLAYNGVEKEGKIVGVIEDFHYQSLHHPIEPLVVQMIPPSWMTEYLSVKFHPGNLKASVDYIREQWQAFNPERPIEYTFLDQSLQDLYQREEKVSKVFTWFAGLAIFISCLGLFGLSAFTAARRTKEIGIRKVLGASVFSIIRLLSKEYFWLVAPAMVLAFPCAWYLLHRWLENFAYHVEMGVGVFVLTSTAMLVIAWLTISYQSIRAATVNPVESLKDE